MLLVKLRVAEIDVLKPPNTGVPEGIVEEPVQLYFLSNELKYRYEAYLGRKDVN